MINPKMISKKNIAKSIRLSDQVFEYINNYEGKGFNEKFENIILFALQTEEDRRNRIHDLEQIIKKLEAKKMVAESELSSSKKNYAAQLLEISRYLQEKSRVLTHDADRLRWE